MTDLRFGDLAHIGHAELLTPEPERSLRFFHEVLRLGEERREGQSVYLRGWGEYQPYSLVLTDVEPSVLLLDDPTRGVDVGTTAEMHGLIRQEAAAGIPVVLCSTEIDELVAVCDRLLVFFRGAICAELGGPALTAHATLEAMNTGAAA